MLYALAIAAMVILDQVVKFLVRSNIALGEDVTFIPHVLGLTYVQNTGAAFSSFENSTLLLALFSVVIAVVLAAALIKNYVVHPFGRWPVALILGGAIGNMIDRFALGFVTDMFETKFMSFPVFNVADIFVVVGVFALCAYVLLGWDKYEPKKEKKPAEPKEEEQP